jgi:hypothetical protein
MKRYVSIYSYALSTQTKSVGLMSRHVYATLERKKSNIVNTSDYNITELMNSGLIRSHNNSSTHSFDLNRRKVNTRITRL